MTLRCVAAIDRVLSEGSLSMEIIVNPKTLDNNVPVIQLETAVGAAMKCFDRGLGVYSEVVYSFN